MVVVVGSYVGCKPCPGSTTSFFVFFLNLSPVFFYFLIWGGVVHVPYCMADAIRF